MVRRIAPALAALFALAAALPAQAQQVVGISAAVKNDVRLKKPTAPLPRPVLLKQRIAIADQVQTGAKSQLQLLLLDKSVFTVGANARLVIDRYVYDPNRGSRSFSATVAKGAFRFMSGKPDRGANSSIKTPVASIGIRGTILEGVIGEAAALIAAGERAVGPNVRSDPATASLIVLRGPGAATQGDTIPGAIVIDANGRRIEVGKPLQAVFVPGPGMAPIGPFRISTRALMQIEALISPSVADRLGWTGPADNLGGDPGSVYTPPADSRGDYPRPPGYPPGYPPGGFPGQYPPSVPGLNNSPPSVTLPSVPLPNLPPPQPRPTNGGAPTTNGQGNAGNNAPPSNPPANNPPPTTSPPPANNPPPTTTTTTNNPPPTGGPALAAPPNNPPTSTPPSSQPPGNGQTPPTTSGDPTSPNNQPPPKGKP